ncbi:hypothetical protein IQ22_01630 [Pseudomonas duriflava]|uniref:Uncharacterized protein n=1 Tax=Pseudomonas duriflava TaxID=459528 RepID=A0A562QG10_9PSED|nr:hypothetical protein IQ22_01630 [Pseudomonas duriflava]
MGITLYKAGGVSGITEPLPGMDQSGNKCRLNQGSDHRLHSFLPQGEGPLP